MNQFCHVLSWSKGTPGAKKFMMLRLFMAEKHENKPTDTHTDRHDSCFLSIDIVHILIDKWLFFHFIIHLRFWMFCCSLDYQTYSWISEKYCQNNLFLYFIGRLLFWIIFVLFIIKHFNFQTVSFCGLCLFLWQRP